MHQSLNKQLSASGNKIKFKKSDDGQRIGQISDFIS